MRLSIINKKNKHVGIMELSGDSKPDNDEVIHLRLISRVSQKMFLDIKNHLIELGYNFKEITPNKTSTKLTRMNRWRH